MTAEEYVIERIHYLENENNDLTTMLEMERNYNQIIIAKLQDVLKMFTFVNGGTESKRFKIDAWEKYDKEQYEKIKELLVESGLFEEPIEEPEKEAESA